MYKSFVCTFLVLFLVLSGCATKSSFEPANSSVKIPSTAKFKLGEIQDNSGFSASSEDIEPVKAMKDALLAELNKAGLNGGDYIINVELTEYQPGNAFARWLLPGLGGTYLKTKTTIIDPESKILAIIPVNRTVAAGGAFTIGAWRECFQDVAIEIVKVLEREMGIS